MAINYKERVNNGLDDKVFVERCIEGLLRAGIPANEIENNEKFIFPHYELLRKRRSNYIDKELEAIDTYGRVGSDAYEQIVPDEYLVVSRFVQELYPDSAEDQAFFKERDAIKEQIEYIKETGTSELEKEKRALISRIARLELKNPVLESIKGYLEEYDALVKSLNGELPDATAVSNLMKTYSLTIKDAQKNQELYSKYSELENRLVEVTNQIENINQNKFNDAKVLELQCRVKEIENYLLTKNTKLINWFLRTYFGNISFDMEDAYQECIIALWDAIKRYDYKKGSFSTFATIVMRTGVSRNLKTLTGYPERVFWAKRSLEVLIEETSKMMGRKVTVEELVESGIIGMRVDKAYDLLTPMRAFDVSDVIEDARYEEDNDKELRVQKEMETKGYLEDDSELDKYYYDVDNDYRNEFDGVDSVSDFDVEYEVAQLLLGNSLKDAMSVLTDREYAVLVTRFGLDGKGPKTLEETGVLFNVSRERIRQIEAKALRKLRHSSSKAKILEYMDVDKQYDSDGRSI